MASILHLTMEMAGNDCNGGSVEEQRFVYRVLKHYYQHVPDMVAANKTQRGCYYTLYAIAHLAFRTKIMA